MSIADSYPGLASLMGHKRLDALLDVYRREIPAESFTPERYRAGFGEFAATRLSDRFAGEIARLESAIFDVSTRPHHPPLRAERLLGLPGDALSTMPLRIRNACVLMETHYPADAFLRSIRQGETPAPRPLANKDWLAIVSHDGEVRRVPLEHSEYRLLQTLAEGLALGDACRRICVEAKLGELELAEKLQGWFAQWLEHGLLQDAASASSSS